MISHFFKSGFLCRALCVILAFLTLAFTLSPALVQPVEAVAVADDITLALTLLFTSWAGITFASNAGAQTAVSNLLSSKPAVASSVAGLITKGLVTESSKLLLTGNVRTAFRDALTDIKDFFATPADSFDGSLYGSSPLGVPIYAPVVPYTTPISSCGYVCVFPSSRDVTINEVLNGHISSSYSSYSSLSASAWGYAKMLSSDGTISENMCLYFITSDGSVSYAGTNFSSTRCDYFILSSSSKDVTHFKQSKYINGTEAEELTWPETTITNPIDPSSPTEDGSENKIPVWPLGPQTSVITNAKTTDQADNDPGLDPEKMIEELRKLLQQPDPNPDPEPDPDPDPDPSDPDTPSGGDGTAPDFNGMMLPGLKDFFPFCIPFDLYDMMQALCAEPEAPKFTFATSFLGQVYTVDIDLSAWNNVAATIRYMVVAIYIVALAVATRKFIKW